MLTDPKTLSLHSFSSNGIEINGKGQSKTDPGKGFFRTLFFKKTAEEMFYLSLSPFSYAKYNL